MSREPAEALKPFSTLPRTEQLFVRGRMYSAPLAEVAARAPTGSIVDIGCGHGALISHLAVGRPDRHVLGVDPDSQKVWWAKASVGRLPNVELRVGTVDSLWPKRADSFDGVVIADVLYLLPVEKWDDFLATAFRLLKPGGLLLLKEAEADRSWRHLKCVAQEAVMVRLLRRTRSSGGLGFQPRAFTEELLRNIGFAEVEATSLARGYTTPHVLFEARRPLDAA